MGRRLATAALLLASGCSEEVIERETVAYVEFDEATVVPEDADPLADDRPSIVVCNELTGWFPEGESLEVDTGSCSYFSVEMPTLIAAEEGSTIVTAVSHFDLTAAEPAEAHVALVIDDGDVRTLWEERIAVPGPAAVYDIRVDLDDKVAAGTRFLLHLHNHGQNTWQFEPISLERTVVTP